MSLELLICKISRKIWMLFYFIIYFISIFGVKYAHNVVWLFCVAYIISSQLIHVYDPFQDGSPLNCVGALFTSDDPLTSSWWLQMARRRIGARPSATTMLRRLRLSWQMNGIVQNTYLVTHYGLMTLYVTYLLVHIGSADGLLLDDTKPLAEQMVTCHQWDSVALTFDLSRKKNSRE